MVLLWPITVCPGISEPTTALLSNKTNQTPRKQASSCFPDQHKWQESNESKEELMVKTLIRIQIRNTGSPRTLTSASIPSLLQPQSCTLRMSWMKYCYHQQQPLLSCPCRLQISSWRCFSSIMLVILALPAAHRNNTEGKWTHNSHKNRMHSPKKNIFIWNEDFSILTF